MKEKVGRGRTSNDSAPGSRRKSLLGKEKRGTSIEKTIRVDSEKKK